MKKILLMILFIKMIMADGEDCLEKLWLKYPSSEFEKTYDRQNNIDRDGESIACNAYTTPSRINNFLQNVYTSMKTNNIKNLADSLSFPIEVYTGKQIVTQDGYMKLITLKINNANEFNAQYQTEVYSKELLEVFKCAQPNKIKIHPSLGFGLGYGTIWFFVDSKTKQLKISKLSSDKKILKKWLVRNCENK